MNVYFYELHIRLQSGKFFPSTQQCWHIPVQPLVLLFVSVSVVENTALMCMEGQKCIKYKPFCVCSVSSDIISALCDYWTV